MAQQKGLKSKIISNVHLSFSCPVCLELFNDPRMLPACGHSFCLGCLRLVLGNQVMQTSLACPECRTVTQIPTADLQTLTSNFALARAVSSLKESLPENSQLASCSHLALAKNIAKCEHCSKIFCDGCQIRHAELLKQEILSIADEISKRTAINNDEERIAQLKNEIETESCKALSKIDGFLASLKAEFEEAFVEAESNMKAQVVEISGQMKKRLESDLSTSFEVSLARAVEEIRGKSVLNLDFAEVGKLRSRLGSSVFEQLTPNFGFKVGRISLRSQFVEERLLTELGSLRELKLKWTSESASVDESWARYVRLHSAAQSGNLDVIQRIFNRLDVADRVICLAHKDQSDEDLTIFEQACKRGHFDLVKFLLNLGQFSSNFRATELPNSLRLAIIGGHETVVKIILKFDPSLVEVPAGLDLAHPIHSAVGKEAILRLLIGRFKASVNSVDRLLRTPLVYAAYSKTLTEMKFLLDCGADVNATDPSAFDANLLHIAVGQNWLFGVTFLLKNYPHLATKADRQMVTALQAAKSAKNELVAKTFADLGFEL